MKKKYISPTVIVRHISTEHTLAVWSILIDTKPKPGIQGDAKRDQKLKDDSYALDELEELEDSIASCYDLPIFF
ncbi:MAG: hypothetical protein MJZ32_12360 [Bacteroidaceae bacterium]|nr:hypothetical protein [Bacteroidaceae bacterium]